MLHLQVAHSLSLNDVCDILQNHSSVLTTIRNAVPPSRSGLSHANKTRNADMAKALFWYVQKSMQTYFLDMWELGYF